MVHPFSDGVPVQSRLRKRYVRHQPEFSVLVQVVQTWFETFVAMAREAHLRLCACVLPILRGFDARRFLVQASRRVPVMHSKARESDRSKPGGLNPAPRCLTPMGAERTLQAACTEGALTDSAQCGGAHPVRGDFPLDVTARPATRSPG